MERRVLLFSSNGLPFNVGLFKKGYFLERWERKPFDMQEMMGEKDSTRSSFLRKHHPGRLESQEKD